MKYVSFLSFFTFVAIFSTPIFFTQRIYAVVSPRGRQVDPLDQHAMHGLTKMGRFFARTRMMTEGPDVKERPVAQQPPIFEAMAKKNWKRVKELVRNNPELVHEKNQLTDMKPLYAVAMLEAPLDVIRLLVSKGANVSEKLEFFNMTLYPIHAAAVGGNLDVMKYIAERHVGGIKVPLLLHAAAEGGNEVVVKYLVEEKGRSIDELGPEGATPLHEAARAKNIGALRYLLSTGAKVNKKDNNGFAPIMGPLFGKNRLSFVKLFVDH